MNTTRYLEVILPITLLIISFSFKLLIDRVVDIPKFIEAISEIPVEILFLALSFVVAYTISPESNNSQGLFYCLLGIIVGLFVVFMWRRCLNLFSVRNNWWVFFLFINLAFSSYALTESISLIARKDKVHKSSATTELKQEGSKSDTVNSNLENPKKN